MKMALTKKLLFIVPTLWLQKDITNSFCYIISDGLVRFQVLSHSSQFSRIKTAPTSFRYQKTCINWKILKFISNWVFCQIPAQIERFLSERHFQNCSIELNFIFYNTLNDIRYLSEIDFKDLMQNSQKMVYLIFEVFKDCPI